MWPFWGLKLKSHGIHKALSALIGPKLQLLSPQHCGAPKICSGLQPPRACSLLGFLLSLRMNAQLWVNQESNGELWPRFLEGAPFSLEPSPNPSLLVALNSSLYLLCLVRLLLSAWSLFPSTQFEKNALKEKARVDVGSRSSLLSRFVPLHLLLSNVCKWLFAAYRNGIFLYFQLLELFMVVG